MSSTTRAQDAQFWNQHYGTKGVLLGGAIIGSVDDLSASFYNPGYLGLKPNPGLSIGTGVFDFTYLSMNNEEIFDTPADRVSAHPAPGLVAGQISRLEDEGNHWTYSFVGRQRFNVLLKGRGLKEYPEFNTSSSGTVNLVQDLSEFWGGVTWSRALTPSLGVGATLYGAYRYQRRQVDILRDSVKTDESIISVNNTTDWSFWNARALIKAGLFWEEGDWSAGLTLTTPSLSLFGNGTGFAKLVIAGSDSSDLLIQVANDGSNTTYKSPMSVGFGAGRRIGNVRLHASVEVFGGVDSYNVMENVEGDGVSVRVIDQLKPIVNFGGGIEVQATDVFSYYLSAVTDYSTIPDEVENKALGLSEWDIVHINGGTVVEVDDFLITAGLGVAFGSGRTNPLTSLQELVLGLPPTDVDVKYLRMRALVGLTYRVSAPQL